MSKHSSGILISAIVLGWLWSASPGAAGTLNNLSFVAASGLDDLSTSDIAGWFLTFDPSNQWTSQSNIATMEGWLAVVEEIAANPPLVNQFYGVGMTDSPPPAVWQWIASSELPQQQQQDFVSEPATLEILGASLASLCLYAGMRARRKNHKSPPCLATKA